MTLVRSCNHDLTVGTVCGGADDSTGDRPYHSPDDSHLKRQSVVIAVL
ncbi:MAG: hypothetical protein F6K09_00085 [Merismopedia sp. SIO2A8]|nr:hypothetical protein [Merismopedia sp. SIO2A8]